MSKKKINALTSAVIVLIFSLIGMLMSDGEFNTQKNSFTSDEVVFNDDEGLLKVHFVDVGQGDCSVVELPDGRIMMIDAGENGEEDAVLEFLDSIGVKKIDYLIATHPHSDHIGGMSEVIAEYEIGEIFMPDVTHSSKTFEKMITQISNKNLSINRAISGKNIFSLDGLRADIISPIQTEYEDLNNYSAVVRLTYGKNTFLFCGDIEKQVEEELLKSNAQIECGVLKVAHRGSSTSSTSGFLKKANPQLAVISCGAQNDYGHPHREVTKRLEELCAQIYRTDVNGTVTITSDANQIGVECERQ